MKSIEKRGGGLRRRHFNFAAFASGALADPPVLSAIRR
jgi:hypothetical protein